MILPSKHLNFSASLLGLGSYILQRVNDKPLSIDEIWEQYNNDIKNGNYYVSHSFDNFILAIIFLYGINTIKEQSGMIYKCN
ncbi:ABC-three component system middle component 6 [Sphingobacterium sp. PM2-P1-29]|jgi:hypothetical protein|uniref:ABC-three component system middle component 6 n=1 Tax=Sphingobacterium humi TaxID=1796905 RepID=UPI0004E5FB8B|nr:conserved hypothetical protein [Sphingobacterium sp. PM2-P1-29]